MLKTTDGKDNYVAFYSQEHLNINQIPKLTFVNSSEENIAPVLDVIGNKNIIFGNTLEFTVTAIDEDGDDLIFTALNLPSGSTFTDEVFKWIPEESDIGNHNITFTVSDSLLEDSEIITITVTDESHVYPRWDVNEDGIVNMHDLDLVALHYGETN